MKKYYSKFYDFPIELENINGEILVKIKTKDKKEIIYSWYDLIDKTSYSPYIKNAILASFIGNIPKNILIIGFGAGSFAKYFKDYLGKKINITGIEIDETMLKIAKNEFKLKDINYFNFDYIEALKIINTLHLASCPGHSLLSFQDNLPCPQERGIKGKFDLIFFDIYDENSKIPESFNNLETINLIKNIITKNGKFIVNFANTKENKEFYKKIDNKIQKVFPKNKIEIKNNKNDDSNIISVYNLEKIINSKDLILEYLQKVQNQEINYDSNLIKNIYLK